MTVARMREEMSWDEYQKWMWKYNHQPFGERAQDMRFLDFMTMYANSKRAKGKRPSPLAYFIKRIIKRKPNPSTGDGNAGQRLGAKIRAKYGRTR